jgi:hypothetical protein
MRFWFIVSGVQELQNISNTEVAFNAKSISRKGLPAWRWIRRSKYGKSVAVLGAGLVGEQEREVIGTLEISYWGITRSRMLGSYGGCTTRITWSKISWPTRRYYLGDFEELMRALRELEIGV